MKILIVEDALLMAKGAQMILKAHHHDPEIAFTPSEALKAVESNPYDTIFMNLACRRWRGYS